MSETLNRTVFESGLYTAALDQWRRSRNPEHRAIAVNLVCDHRVTGEQEREFRTYFNPPYDGRSLKIALIEYHRARVRTSPPAFRHEMNLIADCQNDSGSCCEGFDRNVQLVNILNLSRLRDVLKRVRNEDRPEWAPLRDLEISNYDAWLNSKLLGKDPHSEEMENFVAAVFSVINYNMAVTGPFNPVWVTTWDKFDPFTKTFLASGELNSDRWNQAVGVENISRLWQIVLKYPARDTRFLYRPTQLEGGYYAYHFPSPVMAQMAVGGHPMDLASTSPISPLLPEYIHEQIELKLDYWKNAGHLVGRTTRDRYQLTVLRRKHYEKLKNYYDGVEEWMPSPM